MRPGSDPAGAIPLESLQIANSQVQEHEGQGLSQNQVFACISDLIFLTADLIGLRLMSKACYNPQSALE